MFLNFLILNLEIIKQPKINLSLNILKKKWEVNAIVLLFFPIADNAEQVLAMFSYTAQNEDELTFYKGSVINVLSKDGEWWKGELNGEIGVFPFNYVQVLRGDESAVTSQCK